MIGPDALHGTHIAGIIGAQRNNQVGINGVANNVKIMPIRAIPDGDERDKDIVNAIYYAVDNGAKIINMSFGKYISPNQEDVKQALLYAKEHQVLIIQAAGNDYLDIDKELSYPTPLINNTIIPNYLIIGASTANYGETLFANFSNYGKKYVDALAPGSHIYSTTPNNHYATMSGTSMAAPVATGVAAVLWSQSPNLSASQIKNYIIDGLNLLPEQSVYKPGLGQVPLASIIKNPGVLNLANSLKLLFNDQF